MDSMFNPYQVLGVSDNTPIKECRLAFKRLARLYHPDLHPDNAEEMHNKFCMINRAIEMIESGKVIIPKREVAIHHSDLMSFKII